jgi:hypothetical protein
MRYLRRGKQRGVKVKEDPPTSTSEAQEVLVVDQKH